MTSRVTFGDLAAVIARHLEAPAQQIPVPSHRSRALAAAEADELLAVPPRMLKTASAWAFGARAQRVSAVDRRQRDSRERIRSQPGRGI